MEGEHGNPSVGGWDDEDHLVAHCWTLSISYMGSRFLHRYVPLQQCQHVLKDTLKTNTEYIIHFPHLVSVIVIKYFKCEIQCFIGIKHTVPMHYVLLHHISVLFDLV